MVVQVRVERSKMFCERSEPTLYAAPTCTTIEAPVYVYCLYSSFTTVRLHGGLLSNPFSVQWQI